MTTAAPAATRQTQETDATAAALDHGDAAGRTPGVVAQAGETRLATIESLRALAALGVMVGHVYAGAFPAAAARYGTFGSRVILGGGFGVYLFFALSGYLLFLPFARRDYAGGAGIDLRRYAVNRVVRLFPLYYALIVTLLLLTQGGGTLFDWVVFPTFSQNFFPKTVTSAVNHDTWSLVVEVEFYVLLPLLAIVLARLASGRVERAAALLAGLGVAGLLLRYGVAHGPGASVILKHALPTCFVFFVPGMLLALAVADGRLTRRLVARPLLGSSTAWLAAAVLAWLVVFDDYSREYMVLVASFLTVGGCALGLRRGVATRILEWRPLALLGIASYSLYLWHPVLLSHLASLIGVDFLPLLLAVSCASVLASVVSYRVIERPFLRLRRRWSSNRAHAAVELPGRAASPARA